MRTNIVIDDALMKEAQALTGLPTKKEVVDRALRELVRNLKRKSLADIRGKIKFAPGYDPKTHPRDKNFGPVSAERVKDLLKGKK